MKYVYQATDSVTGAQYKWTTATKDPSGTGYPGPNGPVDVIQLNEPVVQIGDLATSDSAGLMSAAQVATLNAAVLSKAHSRKETDVALSTNSETILIPSIAIGGLAASSTYLFTVGARLAVHRTGVPTTCGYLDIVAYGYVQSNSSGGVGNTLRILGSTPDQSKLPTAIATATAAITDNVDYDFRITATRSTDIAMVVDSVEYWISSLDKLTVS